MRTSLALSLLLLAACPSPEKEEDSGADDWGTRGGDDSSGGGNDTSSEEADDIDPAVAECLTFSVQARDRAGTAALEFTTSDNVELFGVVTNACAEDVSFGTPDSCLIRSMDAVNHTTSRGATSMEECSAVETTWVVPAGASIEDGDDWGAFDAGDYTITATFNYARIEATIDLVVR